MSNLGPKKGFLDNLEDISNELKNSKTGEIVITKIENFEKSPDKKAQLSKGIIITTGNTFIEIKKEEEIENLKKEITPEITILDNAKSAIDKMCSSGKDFITKYSKGEAAHEEFKTFIKNYTDYIQNHGPNITDVNSPALGGDKTFMDTLNKNIEGIHKTLKEELTGDEFSKELEGISTLIENIKKFNAPLKCAKEISKTENTYIKDLKRIAISKTLPPEMEGCVKEILNVSERLLTEFSELEQAIKQTKTSDIKHIAENISVLLKEAAGYYPPYVSYYEQVQKSIPKADAPLFITPIQRFPRYDLLTKSLRDEFAAPQEAEQTEAGMALTKLHNSVKQHVLEAKRDLLKKCEEKLQKNIKQSHIFDAHKNKAFYNYEMLVNQKASLTNELNTSKLAKKTKLEITKLDKEIKKAEKKEPDFKTQKALIDEIAALQIKIPETKGDIQRIEKEYPSLKEKPQDLAKSPVVGAKQESISKDVFIENRAEILGFATKHKLTYENATQTIANNLKLQLQLKFKKERCDQIKASGDNQNTKEIKLLEKEIKSCEKNIKEMEKKYRGNLNEKLINAYYTVKDYERMQPTSPPPPNYIPKSPQELKLDTLPLLLRSTEKFENERKKNPLKELTKPAQTVDNPQSIQTGKSKSSPRNT